MQADTSSLEGHYMAPVTGMMKQVKGEANRGMIEECGWQI
jgi:hypothetical protein